MPRNGYLVVLTACIDPSQGAIKVQRSDPVVRLADYQQALRFWLRLPDPRLGRILFIENSGFPLQAIDNIAKTENPLNKQFESISLNCNDYPSHLDYGYAELNMLDQGLELSELAQQAHYYIKATGRLMFPGISKLLDRLPADYQFAVDSRTALPLFGEPKQLWTHTRLMIFSDDFYRRHLRDVKQRMVKGECVELMLFKFLAGFTGQAGAIRRFPVHVPVRGVSGTSGLSYSALNRQTLDAFRSAVRYIAPWWWI
jgi:hypothetical protein